MKIVFFDGYCGLCNGVVDRLMKLDSEKILRFAPLQGETARAHLCGAGAPTDVDTMIYLRDGERFEKSDAVLQILSDIGGLGQLAPSLRAIPLSLRDMLYRLVAGNRYKIFGRRDSCRIPSSVERERLLS